MRWDGLLLLLALTVQTVLCGVNVTTSVVQYVSGRDTVASYVCIPEGEGPFPAIIAIHEWWGLNDWIKENARSMASKGYVVIAVDLYRGKSTSSRDEAHELSRGLPEDRVARDLGAANTYLEQLPSVDGKRIASIGWCMGGGYSLVAALTIPDLAACVVCYGRLVTDSSSIASLSCPVLGIFGGQDRGIPTEDVREFEKAGKLADKDFRMIIYPDAGHAFMNPNNRTGYRKRAAEDAWQEIYAFFDQTLRPTNENHLKE